MMTSLGKRLIAAAKEATQIARGKATLRPIVFTFPRSSKLVLRLHSVEPVDARQRGKQPCPNKHDQQRADAADQHRRYRTDKRCHRARAEFAELVRRADK